MPSLTTSRFGAMQVKDKALVQKEIRQNADILLKNKVDFIILEVQHSLHLLPVLLSTSVMWRR